jgi:hypothetical protein
VAVGENAAGRKRKLAPGIASHLVKNARTRPGEGSRPRDPWFAEPSVCHNRDHLGLAAAPRLPRAVVDNATGSDRIPGGQRQLLHHSRVVL